MKKIEFADILHFSSILAWPAIHFPSIIFALAGKPRSGPADPTTRQHLFLSLESFPRKSYYIRAIFIQLARVLSISYDYPLSQSPVLSRKRSDLRLFLPKSRSRRSRVLQIAACRKRKNKHH